MTHLTNKRKRLQKITKDREANKKRCCDIYEIINSLDKEELIKLQSHINSINFSNINIYEIINSLDKEELIKLQSHMNSINFSNINVYEIINSLDKEELIKLQSHINSINFSNINIYEIINSLDKEELIKVQNYINSINFPNINIYEILNPLDQDELTKVQSYIDLINPKQQSTIEKKLDALIDKVKSLPDNQILRIEHLINTMTYSKGKTKGEILSPYLQDKANKFVTSAKSLSTSNSELRSFCMKMVRAEEAKQKYISRIQSVAQKSKKITKSQFQIAAKKMIKENNHIYTAEFVKLTTDISNIGTISLSAAAECIKEMITFFTGEPPDYSLSTKTLSRQK
ncbi:8823_t:CDS:2 [Racocetra persica]|uniref:8823_t:CDS:1 n=1 Tax=Racocetra persica TaxID=160502 RepID=A0ACA9N9C2_9GLOM|nr:8823_t:CDS:2 [Racocetra persica]